MAHLAKVTETGKVCGLCGEDKSTSDFSRHPAGLLGLQSNCKPCEVARVAEFLKENPESKRDYNLRYKYGMTLAEYEALLSEQDGGCAICGGIDSGDKRTPNLSVDHDHECCSGRRSCGKCTRGLLCGPCNKAVGYMEDNPERLMAAAAYLIQWDKAGSN